MSEASNTLQSKAYATILDLVSEGEVEGLADGLKSIYLNETPLQNDDGTFNFQGVTVDSRTGTQDQTYIPGFASTESEMTVNLEVKKATPITKSITNPNVNAVRVTMSFPSLFYQSISSGDISGYSVQYKIQVQSNGGGYVDQLLGSTTVDLGSGTTIGSSSILKTASIGISWTGNAAATSQSVGYKLQKLKSGGSWTDVYTGSFSGTGSYWESWNDEGGFSSGYTAPTGSSTQNLTLDGAAYQFRIVQTSGVGTLSISGSAVAGIGTITLSGKTNSKYEKAYRIDLTGSAPWDVRLVRLSDDDATTNVQSKTYWGSYAEIIDAKLRYPNSALVGVRVDSSQFNGIPSRSYDMKLLKVQVPSNYDPTSRAYTGSWDGTFKTAWTDNPAWCFYDLVTKNRYGLGKFLNAALVDKWSLYQIAKYCDQLVPDGFGGFEPRFTCNLYIQSRNDAFKVVQDFVSVFRAITYWAAGSLTMVQDAPADPVALFTNANVIDGTFSYSGSSSKARHTVAMVRWNDPNDMFRQSVEYVEDREGIDRYGYIETDVIAFGCTSRGQANRLGRWILFTERLETESITFQVGLDGALARPGNVIQVADKERAGARQGGRIVSATSSSVVLDAVPDSAVGGTLYLVSTSGVVLNTKITSVAGTTVNVSPSLSSVPQPNTTWILSTASIEPQTFRVVTITEAEQGKYEITAIAHDPNKFSAVENNLVIEPRKISSLTAPPGAPDNVVITESLYQSTAEIKTQVTVSWNPSSNATAYEVSYRVGDDNWVVTQTKSTSIDFRDMPNGAYTVSVVALNSIGRRSVAATATKTIVGKLAPPGNVQNFSLVPVGGMAMLSWDRSVDLDVLVGGSVRIRHTPLTSGQNWSDAIDIMPSLSGTDMHATAPLLAGTYMAKFVDSSGYLSTTASEIVTTVPSLPVNVVSTITESPSFAGTKTNVLVDGTLGGLSLTSGSTAGEYVFSGAVDLGAVYTSTVTMNVVAHAFDRNDLWDLRLTNIDTWTDIDGDVIDDCNVAIYMRTTNDDPAGSPTWSPWKPFFVSSYTARAFQFKAAFSAGIAGHTTTISTLAATVDMPDRVDAQNGLVSGAGSYHVAFTSPFWATPAVGITANAMASGDYYTITGNSASGFDIIFKNSSGTAVSRTFDVMAKGYGRRI